MSLLAISEEVRTLPGSRLRPRWAMAGVAATILVDAVAGFLGWELVQPGETLIGPVSLVALIMALTGTAWLYALKLVGGWRSHRWLWFSVVALCLVPLLWTYFGILPSSLRWDTTGPATVQQILTSATLGCREVDTGSVGLLNAPYEVCATTTSVGYDIEFETLDQTRGYAYIQHWGRLGGWFPDQCARHLFAHWWAFNSWTIVAGNNCPLGYGGQGAA